ncbi:ACT domain-containing protein [Ganoderma leucocontextum]|nr:ACT domain-containing protein [Ganoderma leucocontextum]
MTITRNHPSLRLSVLPGVFYVRKTQEVPADVLRRIAEEPQTLLSITRTAEEISIVGQCTSENQAEGEWRCIKIAGPMPFELTGILHGLLEPLKHADIGIFALSTWNTDYCLIPKDKIGGAVAALREDGWLFDESAATF